MLKQSIFVLLIVCTSLQCISQTIGTLLNTTEASQQFRLLSPVRSHDSYLIDNCGHVYNKWESKYLLGLSSKLDEFGNLFRGGLVNSSVFNAGGKGGVLEKFSREGELLWEFRIANDSMYLHHDFEFLPNGNLLVTAWEYISYENIIELGRDPSTSSLNGFYSEVIIEIDPTDNFNIDWEWHAIDHIIQDRDPSLPFYGDIEQNPQLLDINLNVPGNLSQPIDWLHINSVDYNPELDQILLSCNAINEIIIIDHSTTTLEAEGSSGGNGLKGGDILFRWGNASNYISSGQTSRQLFSQHDANWIIEDGEVEDRVLVFNNGHQTNNVNFSTIDEINLTRVGAYNYDYSQNELNQEKDIIWQYNDDANEGLYSKRMSGVKRISKGRTVISESDTGRIFEIDENGNILWVYINPVDNTGVLTQGDIPQGNTIFKSETYHVNYFDDQVELTTNFEKIELNSEELCEIYLTNITDYWSNQKLKLEIQNNQLVINGADGKYFMISDMSGAVLKNEYIDSDYFIRNLEMMSDKICVLSIYSKNEIYSIKLYLVP